MHRKFWSILACGVLVVVGLASCSGTAPSPTERVPYSTFEKYLHEYQIEQVRVAGDQVYAKLSDGRNLVATRVPQDIASELEQYGVEFSGETEFSWSVLLWLLPMLFIPIWLTTLRWGGRAVPGADAAAMSKSKARIYTETSTKTTFNDVAGVDEAKEELKEVVEFLRDPQTYGRLGAHVPKGVLLVGPPGTGKTLLARAVAGEAAVPFLSINGSEFVELFVGVGAACVRDLFEQGRAKAPAIIFIDELDALGRARGAYGQLAGHDEREQALNQLLSEIDGFDPSVGLVLLGATNRPEILDPELLRAGRFDRQVLVDRPDKAGRIQILKIYLGKIRLGSDAAAIERILAGLEKKNRLLSPKEREIVAYHEMGHALVALILPGVDRVQKVSIIPRGVGALDYTIQRPTEDRFLLTEDELENQDGGAARPPGGRAPGLRQSIDRCGRRSRQSVRYRPQLRRPIWDGSGIGRVGL